MRETARQRADAAIDGLYEPLGREAGETVAEKRRRWRYWADIGEEASKVAIRAAFLAEAALRLVAQWQGCECPEVWEPDDWDEVRDHVCTGYADEHPEAQLVCERDLEQSTKCWFRYWNERVKLAEAKEEGEADGQ